MVRKKKKKLWSKEGVYRCLRSISGGGLWSMDGCRSTNRPWISRIHLLLTVCIIQLLKADFIELKGQWAMGSNACYTQFLKNSFLVIQFFFYCMKYWCYYYLFILILFFIFFSLGFYFFSLFLPLFFYLYFLIIKYRLKI